MTNNKPVIPITRENLHIVIIMYTAINTARCFTRNNIAIKMLDIIDLLFD